MVSVIMPAYNREKQIGRAIESIVKGTYTDWELIVVDDGSTDDTYKVVCNYADKDKRIHCFKSEGRRGAAHARNIGISAAVGKYIAFLDSDDEWLPNHLEECVRVLDEGEYKICSALWLEEFDGKCKDIREYAYFQNGYKYLLDHNCIKEDQVYWKFGEKSFDIICNSSMYCFHICTIVMAKEIVENVGVFNDKLYSSEDFEYCFRIFQKYPLVTINKPHFIYHRGGEDKLYAYVSSEKVSAEYFLENEGLSKKNIKNQVAKMKVMNKICWLIHNSDVSNKAELEKNIYIDSCFRCLTVALLYRNINIIYFVFYYMKSFFYCYRSHFLKVWQKYRTQENISIYFRCD